MRTLDKTGIVSVLFITSLLFFSLVLSAEGGLLAERKTLGFECSYSDECTWPKICKGEFCYVQCRTDRDCYAGWVCRIPNYEQLTAQLAAQGTAAQPAAQVGSRDAGGAIVYIEGVGPGTPVEEIKVKWVHYAQCVPPSGWPNVTPLPGGWPSIVPHPPISARTRSVQPTSTTQPTPPPAQVAPPAVPSATPPAYQVAPPASLQAAPSAVSLEQDIDRPGADFYSTSIKNVDECIALCQKETRCRVFTYYQNNCWLKDGIPAPVPLQGASSGVVRR